MANAAGLPRHAFWISFLLLPVLATWPMVLGISSDPIYLGSGLITAGRPGWLAGASNFDLNVGATTQALGHLAAQQWLNGEIPWWNSFNGIGMPLAGEMQASALFLPFVLLLHFQLGPILLKVALQMVAGLGAYALMRRLEIGRVAAWTGAAMFAFNGTFAWLSHAPMMPVAFLPWIILGIENARRGGFRLLAIAMALSIYAGFPETAYVDGFLALGWAIWRFAHSAARWCFAGFVALGGVLALLLAAPAIWSFGHMLVYATAENHNVHWFAAPGDAMPREIFGSWLFPYLLGPLQAFMGEDAISSMNTIDPNLGGYLGLAPMFLAVAGLAGRRYRGLRLTLAIWILLCVGRAAAVPGVAHLMNLIPLMREVIISRYGVPSWHFAAVVLAVLAIEDWRIGQLSRPWQHLATGLTAASGITALALSWHVMTLLSGQAPEYPIWPVMAIGWGVVTMTVAVWCLRRQPDRMRVGVLALVLVCDAVTMFTLPSLSGVRDATLDTRAIAFLREHLGLQRFYTLGPYRPNYGAYFETAQINHEYLPIPSNWVDHVRTSLDPRASAIMFRGDQPPDGPGEPTHANALVERLAAYSALGVRYVLTPVGADPFVQGLIGPAAGPGAYRALMPGEAVSGTLQVPAGHAGSADAVRARIGTYLGQARGEITVELCGRAGCTQGNLPLDGIADNVEQTVSLSRPLDLQAGETLQWRIRHTGTTPVAVWQLGSVPQFDIALRLSRPPPARVWRDGLVDIYELADAAPYFSADGCRLVVHDRVSLEATCDAPGVLVRRELYFPGWRAWIGDDAVPIAQSGDVMQQIALPIGRSQIRFFYAPPYARLCWALVAIAFIGLLSFRRQRRVAGRPGSA